MCRSYAIPGVQRRSIPAPQLAPAIESESSGRDKSTVLHLNEIVLRISESFANRRGLSSLARVRSVAGATLAALAVISLGCAAMGPPAPSIDVIHDHQPDDIPTPQRFTFDDGELASFAYIKFKDAPRLPMRSMKLTYWGDRPVKEIEAWYLQQMPLHGWKHIATDGYAETHISFSKGLERAEVFLKRTPDENGRYFVTRLIIEIGVR